MSSAMANTKSLFVTTYLAVTTNNLLKNLGVDMTDEEIKMQLASSDSFYRAVLKPPAATILADLSFAQMEDSHQHFQEQLINTIFANYALMAEGNEDNAALPDSAQAEIERLQEECEQEAEKIERMRTEQADTKHKVYNEAVEKIKEWEAYNKQQAEKITEQIRAESFEVSDSFSRRLEKRLNQRAIGVEVPLEKSQAFQFDDKDSPVVQAVMATLLEEVEE